MFGSGVGYHVGETGLVLILSSIYLLLKGIWWGAFWLGNDGKRNIYLHNFACQSDTNASLNHHI